MEKGTFKWLNQMCYVVAYARLLSVTLSFSLLYYAKALYWAVFKDKNQSSNRLKFQKLWFMWIYVNKIQNGIGHTYGEKIKEWEMFVGCVLNVGLLLCFIYDYCAFFSYTT